MDENDGIVYYTAVLDATAAVETEKKLAWQAERYRLLSENQGSVIFDYDAEGDVMAGAVGGGGLGDLAIKYGYNRFQTDVMIYSVAILIVIVQIIQSVGNCVYKRIK